MYPFSHSMKVLSVHKYSAVSPLLASKFPVYKHCNFVTVRETRGARTVSSGF